MAVAGSILVLVPLVAIPAAGPASASTNCRPTFRDLDRAVDGLVGTVNGPPGVIVVVQRGSETATVTAGVADLATRQPPTTGDEMRLASVSKAYSGAAALALVSSGRLSLSDTVGKWLPNLPRAWSGVTLRQLLNRHQSAFPTSANRRHSVKHCWPTCRTPRHPSTS